MVQLEYLKEISSTLGEGPTYNEEENTLYWTDIKEHKIHAYSLDTKKVKSYQFTKEIGSFVFTNENKILATSNDGFEYLDLEIEKMNALLDPEDHLPNNRFNDGKCDAYGRYFAGTMDNNEEEVTGSLYCYDGKNIEKKESDLSISNGLGWNMDSSKFYLTDTIRRIIYVYDYDLKTSTMSNKKIFAKIKDEDGYPDGLCVDSQNHIWSAHYMGWKITRYAPDGNIERIIDLPVPNITCCAFGEKDFKTLFITTAKKGMSKKELKDAPLSGHVFTLKTDIVGQKPNKFHEYKGK